MEQLRYKAALTADSMAAAFGTGRAPGKPRQTGQTLELGGSPKRLAQPQNILVAVLSWTWTSRPMTGWNSGMGKWRGSERRTDRRAARVKIGKLLPGVADAEEHGLVEGLGKDLEADGEAARGETAGEAEAGNAGEVDGDGEDIREIHLEGVVEFFAEGEGWGGRGGGDDSIYGVKGAGEILADEGADFEGFEVIGVVVTGAEDVGAEDNAADDFFTEAEAARAGVDVVE